MFNFFKDKTKKVEELKNAEIQLPPSKIAPENFKPQLPECTGLKALKWVVVENKYVGIIAKVLTVDTVEVHYTNDKGETILQDTAHIGNIRLARLHEIPEPRRPSPELAQKLNYF